MGDNGATTTQAWGVLQEEPNLKDLEELRGGFSWNMIREELDGLPLEKGLNIAHEAVDRHANGDKHDRTAIRWFGKDGAEEAISYRDLKDRSDRFANVLERLGVRKGDAVFTLLGRVPELYTTVFGALKKGAVFSPLFSAFGPDPVSQRLGRGKGKVLVTTQKLYEKRVRPILDELPKLEHVILIDAKKESHTKGLHVFSQLMEEASTIYDIPETSPEDPALLHFTSGTTGLPKGAVHVHEAVLVHYMTGKYVLDLHPDDVFWCTADPGWVTGTSYGIIAPLLHGVTNVVDESGFDVERWFRILQDQEVNVWYTAPTAIRSLMRSDVDPIHEYDLSKLRWTFSVGEPLNPSAIEWGKKKLGLTIKDSWWQTETGGIMIANFPGIKTKPGSMGLPLPGIEAEILVTKENGEKVPAEEPNTVGDLALKKGWPSMFRDYLNQKEKYRNSFYGDWYITEDLAKKDEDGYFWFVGRADDIIKTAGHMVGPFEVESALMEHEAVAEAAVIGVPEPTIGQMVKAYVVLNPGYEGGSELERKLIGFARKRLGSAVAPKAIDIKDELPKTKSGKIMRRLLKARELGEPEGDTSMLEEE